MKTKQTIVFIVFFLLMSIFECFANSAGPPSIIIITTNSPDDLQVIFIMDGEEIEADKHNKFNEEYYLLYDYSLSTTKSYLVRLSSSDGSYILKIEKSLNKYNNIYRLDYKSQTLVAGKGIVRSTVLVSTRVILTLLIEGLIFLLFKYRELKSWIVFIIINLITQGALNIWINTAHPFESYIVLYLIFAEYIILIVELLGLTFLIKEKKQMITVVYVVIANFTSLALGAIIIPQLPI